MPVGHYKRGASLEERFWTKVDKTGDCWIFQTNTLVGGYGRLKIEGRMVLAHRHAFEIQHGPVPDGHNVFQRCRNKLCMRGDHLYTGGKNTGPKEDRPLGLPDKGAFASDDWRDIDGFPGYEVSRFGEVRSWWRRGHSMYAEKPKLLTAGPGGPGGYYYVINPHLPQERRGRGFAG